MVRHEYLQYVLFRTSRVAALNSIISVYLCRKWIIGRSFFRPVDGQVHFRWTRRLQTGISAWNCCHTLLLHNIFHKRVKYPQKACSLSQQEAGWHIINTFNGWSIKHGIFFGKHFSQWQCWQSSTKEKTHFAPYLADLTGALTAVWTFCLLLETNWSWCAKFHFYLQSFMLGWLISLQFSGGLLVCHMAPLSDSLSNSDWDLEAHTDSHSGEGLQTGMSPVLTLCLLHRN